MRMKSGQTSLEYILLLMAVVAIVLIAFTSYMPQVQEGANTFYNRAVPAITGPPPRCGDGHCSSRFEGCAKCPTDCHCP
jgi:Flp pilus assembly pilin Flp